MDAVNASLLPAPLIRPSFKKVESWLSVGNGHVPPQNHSFPGVRNSAPSGEEVLIRRCVKALHVTQDGLDAPARGHQSGEAAAAVVVLRTSPGEVPQLFPANCFTYVLEKDMALSFRNHSSVQWVQQGANTCETPIEAAPSPFLKHFFVCLHSGKPTAGLFDPIFSLHHTHIKLYNSV